MKYKFEHIDEDGKKVTSEFYAEDIDDVVQQFRYFLYGVSFNALTINEALGENE